MNSNTFSYMTAEIIFPPKFDFLNLCRFLILIGVNIKI